MKYVGFGSFSIDEYENFSSTVYGHANANGAEAVGAAFYQDTPEFGVAPPLLESFSSAGLTPILFDTAGNPTFELRAKPEIVAPDGTNTTFFGGSDVEGDGFPNFFGTSAAAPHAAAVGALMLDANAGLSPSGIYTVLENTAIDMNDPLTIGFDVGFDDASGFGLIQADVAVEAAIELLEPNDTIFESIATGVVGSSLTPFVRSSAVGNNPNVPPELDVDLYEFQLHTGERVTIDIDADEFGSSLDSGLRLFDSSGNEVAVSDDDPAPGEPGTLDSYIDFTASETDIYYVDVSGFSNFGYDPFVEGSGSPGSTGDYDIEISITDEPNDSRSDCNGLEFEYSGFVRSIECCGQQPQRST